MTHNLNNMTIDGPNPPPWKIDYINDQESDAIWYNGILPEAHTHGICKFNRLDLQIRKAPPNVAAVILDKVGLFLMLNDKKAKIGDKFIVDDTTYTVVPALDSTKRPVLRLAWVNDPCPEDRDYQRIRAQFDQACSKLQIEHN